MKTKRTKEIKAAATKAALADIRTDTIDFSRPAEFVWEELDLYLAIYEQTLLTNVRVGMGATWTIWTDRKACTVIAVSKSGKTITLQEDKAIRVDKNGMSECQEYRYEPNPEAPTFKATLRTYRDGTTGFKRVGSKTNSAGQTVSIGTRRTYHDYSF